MLSVNVTSLHYLSFLSIPFHPSSQDSPLKVTVCFLFPGIDLRWFVHVYLERNNTFLFECHSCMCRFSSQESRLVAR